MGPSPHLLVPDSSAKALIAQQRSSSSPTSSISSPGQPSPSTTSPSQHPSHSSHPSDLSLPSSSSSLSSLVPEITSVPQSKGVRHRRRKKQQQPAHKEDKQDGKSDHASQERSKQGVCERDSANFHKKKKGCQDNVCCKCTAAFTADCAAVCCCPLALLHLAALTFIRLPTAVAWKMLVGLKNKIYTKRRATKESEEDSPRPNLASPWSHDGSSPERKVDRRAHSENLWQHFEAGSLDFGGLSMRRDTL